MFDRTQSAYKNQVIKRIQLFELEDLPWFGKTFRAGMTNLLKACGLCSSELIHLKITQTGLATSKNPMDEPGL